ncbi:hypothetical protein CsSME_00023545 [Camellia sinensis var. sinensis]
MKVEVVRNCRRQSISIFEVVVGDIACLKIGDQVLTDGLFLDGHSLKVDESSMTSYIWKVSLLVAFLVLVVLLIRYFIGNTEDEHGNQEFNRGKTKANDVMNVIVRIVAAVVTIVVVSIPKGLPLAVTLTLAYSIKMMMVRKLSAYETMEVMTDKASLKIAPNALENVTRRQLSISIPEISGSPTESAILSWVVFDLAMDIDELKQGHEILHVEAFN